MKDSTARHRTGFVAAMVAMGVAAVWLLAIGARRKGFDWQSFTTIVSALDCRWLGLGLLWSYMTYAVRALRWAVLLEPLRPRASFRGLLAATVIGYSAVTALGRPAEMVRPYLIATREHVPFSSQLAAWLVERIYDVLVALAVFGFALEQVTASGVSTGAALAWVLKIGGGVIGGGAALCLLTLMAMAYRSDQIQCRILRSLTFLSKHRLARVERLIGSFLDGVRCTRSQSATLRLIGYTLAEWCLVAACYACVLKAFGGAVQLQPVDILVLMGFVSFGSLVQLPAVGGGAQMTAVLVLTQVFGVSLEASTGIALLLWLILFVAIVPAGLILGLREGLTWARLREPGRGAVS